MPTIVHPTDFTQASYVAFKHALRIALVLRARLVVIHVDRPGTSGEDWSRYPHIRETLVRWGVVGPEMEASDLKPATGLSVEKISAHDSDPVSAIAEFLEREPVDLVVMTTHGRAGLSAFLQPSQARRLGRLISRPILFVREGVTGFIGPDGSLDFRHVLVPLDHEPDPQLAIDWTSRLESWFGTRIGVVEAIHAGPGGSMPEFVPPHLSSGSFRATETQAGPAEAISEAAEKHGSDLLVMVTAGPQGMRERLLGSTTEKTVMAAPCPVLAIPAPGYGL